jgi:hypothetical protein
MKEAKRYKTRMAMRYGSVSAYNAAVRDGYLDEVFAKHQNRGYDTSNPRWRKAAKAD